MALKAVVQPGARSIPSSLGGRLEAAAAEPAQEHVTFATQHDEVGLGVAVDVEGIGTGHGGQVGDG